MEAKSEKNVPKKTPLDSIIGFAHVGFHRHWDMFLRAGLPQVVEDLVSDKDVVGNGPSRYKS